MRFRQNNVFVKVTNLPAVNLIKLFFHIFTNPLPQKARMFVTGEHFQQFDILG